MPASKLIANGINGVTGQYDLPPMALEDLARALRGIQPEEAAPDHVTERGRKLSSPPSPARFPGVFSPTI